MTPNARSYSGPSIAGLVLAGGEGARMGGLCKASVTLGGTPLVQIALQYLRPQCHKIALSIHRDGVQWRGLGVPLLTDSRNVRMGPASGLREGLVWCGAEPRCRWLAIMPVDTPFLPEGTFVRLVTAAIASQAKAAYAVTRNRPHPAISVWSLGTAQAVLERIDVHGEGALYRLLSQSQAVPVDFDCEDQFINLNTHEDLLRARSFWPAGGVDSGTAEARMCNQAPI